MFIKITPTQESILLHLSKYKFLTTKQMLRLGVASHQPGISKNLGKLRRLKWVDGADFTVTQRDKGKVRNRKAESFYFLTKKGASEIIERRELAEHQVKFPKGTSTLFSDKYFHRKYAIDCEVEANLCALEKGYKVVLFDRDFDRTGSNRTSKGVSAKTKIESKDRHIVPDGNFILSNGQDYKLFTFELHNERNPKEIVKQLVWHTYAVENGSLGVKYKVQKLHRVLNVFVNEGKMKAMLTRLQGMKEFDEMENFFFFKSLDQVKNGLFYDEWLNLSGQVKNLL